MPNTLIKGILLLHVSVKHKVTKMCTQMRVRRSPATLIGRTISSAILMLTEGLTSRKAIDSGPRAVEY